MESNSYSTSQQVLCKDVELGKEKEKKAKYRSYQCAAVILSMLFLLLALCIFSMRYIWNTSPEKVYDHQYKAVLDGMETISIMQIHPAQGFEIFKMGNGTDEVLEVHDFKNAQKNPDLTLDAPAKMGFSPLKCKAMNPFNKPSAVPFKKRSSSLHHTD